LWFTLDLQSAEFMKRKHRGLMKNSRILVYFLLRLAFQALLQDVRRETPNPKGTEYVLKTSFVLRDSTAMHPGKGRS